MFLKFSQLVLAVLIVGFIFSGCTDPEPEPNDEEVITTMILTFVAEGGQDTLSYQFRDEDGPGGQNPVQDDIVLDTNTLYSVSIQLLNETETPAGDITEEVKGEAEAHRFYYEPSAGSNIEVLDMDKDSEGITLGLESSWTTSSAANGMLTITLRHYGGNPPSKAESDPANSSKSDTDIEVIFDTIVK